MTAHSVDEFLATIDGCSSIAHLFDTFRHEIEREGFQNIVFARQSGAQLVEIPYLAVPDGALQIYLEQNLSETDPMVRLVQDRRPAFTWEEMAQQCVSKAERQTLGICREIGCTGGYAIPFYGPHGVSDVFDITFREPRELDTSRLKVLSMKTYATWLRFLELDSTAMANDFLEASGVPAKAVQARSSNGPHIDGSEAISAAECQALVVCDIAMRRYLSGLAELNEGLEATLGANMFYRLRSRGLLMDVPDDEHMRYYFAPSPVAVAHLKRCPQVAIARNDTWRLHVRTDERPSSWFLRP